MKIAINKKKTRAGEDTQIEVISTNEPLTYQFFIFMKI